MENMAYLQEPYEPGLERGALGPIEIFGQTVGNTGMATVVALTPALVAASAGNGSWLSMLVAAIGVLGIGYCVAVFARRVASSGSLYTYAAQSLGKGWAYVVGWALLIAYAGLAISIPPLGAEFLGEVFGQSGATQIVLYLLLTVAATAMAFRGVRISTRTALALEAVSLTLLGIVLIATVAKAGTVVDSAQLTLRGLSAHKLFLGITLSVTGLVGFESAAALGSEARHPYKAIPRVTLMTIGIAAVVYIVAIYVESLGYHHLRADISVAAAPTATLATWAGVHFLKYPIALGLGFSFFSIMLACLNAVSRMLYTMAREGVAPAALGRVHTTRRTPYVGMLLLSPFLFAVAIVMKYVAHTDPSSAFAYIATPSTFAYIFAYIVVAVGAPIIAYRQTRRVHPLVVAAATAGAATMIATYIANVVPTPPDPYNVLPYIFVGLMLVGWSAYLTLRVKRPHAVQSIGTMDEEAELEPMRSETSFAHAEGVL